MTTVLIALAVMLLFVLLMSVGVIFGRKPLKGSCGGMGAALGEKDYVCDLCGGDESKCEEINATDASRTSADKSSLAYDASSKKDQ